MKKYIFIFMKQKLTLVILGIIAILSSAVGIVGTYLSGMFIDTLIESTYVQELFRVSIYLLSVFMLGIILRFIVGYLYGPAKERIVYTFKKHILYQKKENLDVEFSYLSKRVDEDTRQFIGFVLDNYTSVVISTVELFVVGYLMFSINFHIGLVSLIICPIYFVLYRIFRKPIYNKSLDLREGSTRFFQNYADNLNIPSKEHELDNMFQAYYKKFKSYVFINITMNSSQSIFVSLMQVLIFIIGGAGVIRGVTTVGMLSILMTYFNQMLGNISYFMELAKKYQVTRASVHRIDELLT